MPDLVRRATGWVVGVPLRARLVTIIVLLLAAGLLLASTVTRTVVSGYLVAQVDEQLERTAVGVANKAFDGPGTVDEALPSDYYIVYRYSDDTEGWWATEATVARYGAPAVPELTYDEVETLLKQPFTVGAADSGEVATSWRVMPLVATTAGSTATAFVALPLAQIEKTVEFLARSLAISGLGIIVVGGIAAWLLVQRSLRPLREIETTAAAIAAGDLSQRVPAAPATTEVGSLSGSLNTMLAQIERAFSAQEASEARMRRFVSDASHELRTPLATIRGYGELYRMGALDTHDKVDDTMGRIEDAARRMGALVNDLLVLARLDEGRPVAHEPVDLAALARESAQDLHALDPTRDVRMVPLARHDGVAAGPVHDGAPRVPESVPDGAAPVPGVAAGPVPVTGDADRLRQVLTNLIGNVARHTPAGTPTEIALGTADGQAVVEVRDHGPGVTQEQAERMFERFYRADSSRTRESGGSGLGLAIVAAIVGAHDGHVEVAPTPGGGLTVRVRLPLRA